MSITERFIGQFARSAIVLGCIAVASTTVVSSQRDSDYQGSLDSKGSTSSKVWRQINGSGFGNPNNIQIMSLELFNEYLYAATRNDVTGVEFWRSAEGQSWERVSTQGLDTTAPQSNRLVTDMIVFNGALFAFNGDWGHDDQPLRIWKSDDGIQWESVMNDGFGSVSNDGTLAVEIFNNELYVATYGDRRNPNRSHGTEIWRSASGEQGSWVQVAQNGFNQGISYHAVTDLTVYKAQLYVGVESAVGGAQVWRSTDGSTWTQANADGFGDIDNWQTGAMEIFNDYLYVSTRNDITAGQLWRTADGTTWEAVVADGFGDTTNHKIESLKVYDGQLFAATANGQTGIEVWVSSDGENWQQSNADGFGTASNLGTTLTNGTIVFGNTLYFGVFNNVDGGQLWQLSSNPVGVGAASKWLYLPIIAK